MKARSNRFRGGWRPATVLAAVLLISLSSFAARRDGKAGGRGRAKKFRKVPTRCYLIYTDLEKDMAREAALRMTSMAEEYHRRTRGFAGSIKRRLPFYLFSSVDDYLAAGGIPNSAGMYNGRKLMAVASGRSRSSVWRVVQHEGFHQFARVVISDRLPMWVNEGLAEYFGQGIWTGDGFVTGLIPPDRLRRVQAMIKGDQLLPILEMMGMDHETWNSDLSVRNYDQAWSICHFLVHADDGKYRKAFSKFIRDIAKGRAWEMSFRNRFGRDIKAFQKRYSTWWTSLPKNPSREQYAVAVVQVLTSFLARAHRKNQAFDDFDDFLTHARAGTLKYPPKHWLPPSLLARVVKPAEKLDGWSLAKEKSSPRLVLALPDRERVLTGSFAFKRGTYRIRVDAAETDGKTATSATKPAASAPIRGKSR